ncbi:MAG TPA: response regulator [Candidatus Eisenbergiella merdavium]|uniref:Stage 0 sporulation protein A homolog n=1 Tax=Candidatus Eisenbergiella merdavium TaxID=2838551 RepID=A0A9D2NFY0_9FIRM|nr:response regulator [Candidatus Eisenbergiella merdavium]
MIKVLIADDEPSVIRSLQASIDWKGLNMEIAGTVSNGSDALAILSDSTCDIAILDIRMPGCSGLDICRQLHEKNSRIQIIIISGYAEFSYAQKAISYGVIGYCLKPVEYSELTTLLRRAAFNLTRKSEFSDTYDSLLDAIDANNADLLPSLLSSFGLDPAALYVAVSTGDRMLDSSSGARVTLRLGRRQYAYLFREEPSGLLSGTPHIPERLAGLGIFPTDVLFRQLKDALSDCVAMAYQFFIDPECRICQRLDNSLDSLILSELSREVSFSNRDKVLSLLTEIRDSYRLRFNIRSALQLGNIIISGDLFPFEKNDYYLYGFDQMVSEYHSFRQMLDCLAGQLRETDQTEPVKGAISNVSFLKLLKYVNSHYTQDISLSETASVLNMNPNYVSQMFKKETGVTFTHYITDLRITEAKKLLRTTRHPISDIAPNVGFNDYFYFLKTFKRVTGRTPSQYRTEL